MNQARVPIPLPTFAPPPVLGNPHVQTILSSVGRRWLLPRRESAFIDASEKRIFDVDGVKLAAFLTLRPDRPLVMIIPGWLGCHFSSYVLSGAAALWQAGFSVARINLRDHGFTADLNPGLFNSAMIEEVVGLVDQLTDQFGRGTSGLVGYSLGGNFALRVARARSALRVLAVCPAIAPGPTMARIDRSPVYQRYFINKWRKVWAEKQAAFPDLYDFAEPLRLTSVSTTTDYFVRYHSPYETTAEYFAKYDLSGDALAGVGASILAAEDDPIIAAEQYRSLPDSLDVELTAQGGHGAYISDWTLNSWVDRYIVNHFASRQPV